MARRKKLRRSEPDTPDLAKKRNLARLHLARSDIQTAQRLCEKALTLDLASNEPTSWAFHNAVVVTYARPFVSNDSVGALSSKWQRFDDPHLQLNHDLVMQQRDQVVGHSEAHWRPVVISGPGMQLQSGLVTAHSGLYELHPVLAPISYEAVLLLCADLFPRLNAAFDELFLKIFPGGYHGPPITLLPGPRENEPGIRVTFG